MKRIVIAIAAVLACTAPAIADAGFSDDWSIKGTIIFGLLIGMPMFIPSALSVSVVVAATRALIRRRHQAPGYRIGSTFFITLCCCALLYVIGMAIYVGIAVGIESWQERHANKRVESYNMGRADASHVEPHA